MKQLGCCSNLSASKINKWNSWMLQQPLLHKCEQISEYTYLPGMIELSNDTLQDSGSPVRISRSAREIYSCEFTITTSRNKKTHNLTCFNKKNDTSAGPGRSPSPKYWCWMRPGHITWHWKNCHTDSRGDVNWPIFARTQHCQRIMIWPRNLDRIVHLYVLCDGKPIILKTNCQTLTKSEFSRRN